MSAAVLSVPDPAADGSGLSAVEADRIFSGLSTFSALAMAVSGGADSVALLRLFSNWAGRSGWTGKFTVLTVDHRLRPESCDEAAFVAGLCRHLGHAHRTLVWQGEKPETNVQAHAREERFRLIANAVRELGAEALLLAHHQDDQVETFLDRLTRGSGIYGLSAMAADEVDGYMGLRLLRPLLGVPKSRLVRTLEEMGQSWCEDPSNQKTGYKRVRLRRLSEELAAEGFDLSRLQRTIAAMQRTRDAIDQWVSSFVGQFVEQHPAGPVRVSQERLAQLPEEVRLRFLSRALCVVSGSPYPVRLEKLQRLDLQVLSGEVHRHTLSGAVMELKDGDVFFWKERGRTPPAVVELEPGQSADWDLRFRVDVSARAEQIETICLGPLSSAPGPRNAWAAETGSWPSAAFETAPCIWSNDVIMHVPGFEGASLPAGVEVRVQKLLAL